MKSIKQHLIVAIFVSVLVSYSCTITMGKKLALLTALAHTATSTTSNAPLLPNIPLPPILSEIDHIYEGYPYAYNLKRFLDEYIIPGLMEPKLCNLNDWLYTTGYHSRYIVVNYLTRQGHRDFTANFPTFTEDLQALFDDVCCDDQLTDYIETSIKCCRRAPDCQPAINCSTITDWPHAIDLCEDLRSYKNHTCNTTIPRIVPKEIVPLRYRFNDTSLIIYPPHRDSKTKTITLSQKNAALLTTLMNRAKPQDPLDDAQQMYEQLKKALVINSARDFFESGKQEQNLAQAGDNYLSLYDLYINGNYEFYHQRDVFTCTYPDFQKSIEKFNTEACCNQAVMDHIKKLIACCSDPLCAPGVDCSPVKNWFYTILTCDNLNQFKCNTTIPELVPENLKPRRRFSNAVPLLLIDESDDAKSSQLDALPA